MWGSFDAAPQASEEKLSRLVSEFGILCKRRKLRLNVGKSKVIRCSRYGNGGRMNAILNDEPLKEADCFKPGVASGS